jgi:hypothetical protein
VQRIGILFELRNTVRPFLAPPIEIHRFVRMQLAFHGLHPHRFAAHICVDPQLLLQDLMPSPAAAAAVAGHAATLLLLACTHAHTLLMRCELRQRRGMTDVACRSWLPTASAASPAATAVPASATQ